MTTLEKKSSGGILVTTDHARICEYFKVTIPGDLLSRRAEDK